MQLGGVGDRRGWIGPQNLIPRTLGFLHVRRKMVKYGVGGCVLAMGILILLLELAECGRG